VAKQDDPQEPQSNGPAVAALVAAWILAQQALLSGTAKILRATLPTLLGRQQAYGQISRLTKQVVFGLDQRTPKLIEDVVREVLPTSDLAVSQGERAADLIRADLSLNLRDVRFRLTRWPDDVYKAITPHAAIEQILNSAVNPRQAQADAWAQLIDKGITGYTDSRGREWSLQAYVEMAIRTTVMRAFNASHAERMTEIGIHYFTVTDTLHPCPLCFPWQGMILTDGPNHDLSLHSDATIAEATAAGLFHPECRHVLVPYFHGVTVLPKPREWTEADAEAYKATQRLRRLENGIRKAKVRAEYALTPEARQRALVEVRKAQAVVRKFTAETGVTRQSHRERPFHK
jgi:hypothetical protein